MAPIYAPMSPSSSLTGAPHAPDVLLVLASASPRRMDLLKAAGIPHAVRPTDVDESPQIGEAPRLLAARISQAKADAAAAAAGGADVGVGVILAADTIVVAGEGAGECTLGKPPHEGAARQMLLLLSGGVHRVLTGTHLRFLDAAGQPRRLSRVVETEVEVRPLRPHEIDAYLRSQEWRGKAGGYAIQGRFSCFVRGIKGSYDNVVGLPVCQVIEDLQEAGLLPGGWPAWRA